MRPSILICLFLVLFSKIALAQSNYAIKGIVADSVEKVKLQNSSIAVLEAKDSLLVKYTRAAEDGTFSIAGLTRGNYILLVSYPEYADYTRTFSLDSSKQLQNFGNINIVPKTRLLKEVIIKGTAAQMKIKGDTTEFNAKAFVTQPNAKVEDLLKQLPGITVDQNGNITAQGEAVKKVLVDGEEFFGDDPTLVTKNIRADMVDKVQVYDKKSDQATFTGIDDGKKEKTINIKLREDKKKGMFGKVEVGDGPENVYQGELLFNAFKAKQKFSVYGTLGTNGKVGLGWQDNQKYGSGDEMQFGDGFVYFGGNGGDDLDSFGGQYSGQGLPLARSAGVHYDNKWDSDKQSINANYKVGSLQVDGTQQDLTQNNIKDTVFNTTSNQKYHNFMFRQKASMVYQLKIDTSSNLKISIDGTQKHSTTLQSYSSYENRNDTLVNKSTRNINNTVDQTAFNASAFYTKKFKKTGRTLSILVSEAYSQSKANGFLGSVVGYYNGHSAPDSTKTIDQAKKNNLKSQTVNTNLTYSEPLSKTVSVLFNYGLGYSNSVADRRTFTPTAPGVYNYFVDSLSSDFRLNQVSNQAGAVLNYKKGKTIFNFGTKVSDVHFHEVDQFTNDALNRSFINWMPQARYEYRFSQFQSFSLQYNGNTTQPTLDEIQPLRVNNDPLNIVLGNPLLNPSFTNSFNFNYRSYKVISDQSVYVGGNYSFTTDPIISHINYDGATGASTSQYFNLSGHQNTSFFVYGGYSRKIPKIELTTGINWEVDGNTYQNYSNGVLNLTKNYTFNPGLNFSRYKEKSIEFNLSGGPTYTLSNSSLNPNINNNGWGARGNLDVNVYLPAKFQVGTNSNYQYQGPTQSFPHDFTKTLINLSLIRTFGKTDNLKLELWVNDLLNQNVGFSRNASANLITQNSYTTIKRYFMFTVTYDFTHMAGGSAK